MNVKASLPAYTRQVIDLSTASELETAVEGVDGHQEYVSFLLVSAPASDLQFVFGTGNKAIPADEIVGKTIDFTNHGSQPPGTSGIFYKLPTALAPGNEAVIIVTFNRRCEGVAP